MIKQKKAIVLVSGGLDSCVCASIAQSEGYDLYFLNIRYGQRTQDKEYESFLKLSKYFNVKDSKVVDISYLKEFGRSYLTDESLVEEKTIVSKQSVHNTFVPFRNANILSIAAAWAEVIEANAIYIGANYDDYTGYPDCRPEFFDAFNQLLDISLAYSDAKVIAPLVKMSKKEIVEKGYVLKSPFELTWSCYVNNDISCGVCSSCRLRLQGFEEAGLKDPLKYMSSGEK